MVMIEDEEFKVKQIYVPTIYENLKIDDREEAYFCIQRKDLKGDYTVPYGTLQVSILLILTIQLILFSV